MKNKISLLMTFLGLAILAWPQSSYADWGWGGGWGGARPGFHGDHPYYHYYNHPAVGFRVGAFYPHEYFAVRAGGRSYYYDDGVYYNYAGGAYVVVAPPVGAVVTTIPSVFQPVIIHGRTYYFNSGTYYIQSPGGYQVVAQPV